MSKKNASRSNHKVNIITQSPPKELINSQQELYEVLRIEDGIPLFLEDHLLRLKSGFEKLNLLHPFPEQELTDCIVKLIKDTAVISNNLKISCFIEHQIVSSYYMYTIPSVYPSASMYANGIQTALLYAERDNPNIKIGHSQTRSKADEEIGDQKVHEVLLVDQQGLITEGSRSNAFFIVGDTIYTAPTNLILPGVIRKKVLEIIVHNNFNIKMEGVPASKLEQIDSAFITGTSPRILPISQINKVALDVNKPLLRLLMEKLSNTIDKYKTSKC